MTLYKNLKDAESLNADLKSEIFDFADSLRKYKSLPGYFPIIPDELPRINTSLVQRRLMEQYENNPIFSEAIKGRQNIEDTLNELAEVNKGVKRFFPRRKNKVHNERVDQISELVKTPISLYTRGIFNLDNFAAGASLPIAAGVIAKYITPEIESNKEFEKYVLMTLVPILALGVGIASQSLRGVTLPLSQARYIDSKIKEFY